jgi:hypothetical protein
VERAPLLLRSSESGKRKFGDEAFLPTEAKREETSSQEERNEDFARNGPGKGPDRFDRRARSPSMLARARSRKVAREGHRKSSAKKTTAPEGASLDKKQKKQKFSEAEAAPERIARRRGACSRPAKASEPD